MEVEFIILYSACSTTFGFLLGWALRWWFVTRNRICQGNPDFRNPRCSAQAEAWCVILPRVSPYPGEPRYVCAACAEAFLDGKTTYRKPIG